MKKYFVVAIALLAVMAVAIPASAKVEFTYGGLFRARIISQSDFASAPTIVGTTVVDRDEDTLNRLDQRLRLYFTFTASENLKLVTKFEANEIWGNSNSSGKVGADHPNDFVVKNSYIDFNIPNAALPLNAKVGVQGINLIDSWVVDDDFSSANITAKFDNVKVMLGYIAGQNNDVFNERENIDDWFAVIDWVCGPWSAQMVGFYQNGNDTLVSADPSVMVTPVPAGASIGNRIPTTGTFNANSPRNFFQRYFPFGAHTGDSFVQVFDNNLFDLAFRVNYKVDYLSAYLAFVKNFGSVEFGIPYAEGTGFYSRNMDYTGWMVDAGVSYFCGPFTFNLGGFYTSGPEDIADSLQSKRTGDIDWFVYPLATTKYFSEIIGGGILDNRAPQHEDFQWTGYGFPSNLWTVNLGMAWQALPSTKVAFSYWYFGTAEDVVSGPKRPSLFRGNQFIDDYFNGLAFKNDVTFDSDIGHEFDLNISHKIVDGLMLDLVGAYLISGDAYSMRNDDLDALELGARLQWSF